MELTSHIQLALLVTLTPPSELFMYMVWHVHGDGP